MYMRYDKLCLQSHECGLKVWLVTLFMTACKIRQSVDVCKNSNDIALYYFARVDLGLCDPKVCISDYIDVISMLCFSD